jgi:ribosomal protein L3 glutamine methyltransferase
LLGKKYNIIISNPPYVSAKEHYCLPAEYQNEPKLALISGNDGLDCTRKILAQAYDFLHPKGLLFVEVGSGWKKLNKQYLQQPFQWLNFANGGEGIFMLMKEQLRPMKK